MGSGTIEAPSAEAAAEAEATLAQQGTDELSIAALVELVKGEDTPEEQAAEAMTELESRADDGIEEAQAALAELGADPAIEGAPPAPGEAEAAAAERVAEGLPTAADDGGDVDLSQGVDLQIPGLEGGLKLSFQGIGGKRPEESELRVVGGAFKVPGQFEKGTDLTCELRLRVTEVAFSDVIDNKTAQATTSKRKHKGRVIGAVIVEQGVVSKLDELTEAVNGVLDGTTSLSVLAGILGRDDDPASLPTLQLPTGAGA